jgi:hypothetical protein
LTDDDDMAMGLSGGGGRDGSSRSRAVDRVDRQPKGYLAASGRWGAREGEERRGEERRGGREGERATTRRVKKRERRRGR